jgi:hypothetical protein
MLSGPPLTGTIPADQLLERFLSGSPRQRRSLLDQLHRRREELLPLLSSRLEALDPNGDDWGGGFLVQMLLHSGAEQFEAALLNRYPAGWLAVGSDTGIDFAPLQRHLMRQEYQAADRLTSQHLRQLAGPAAEQRGYVYYSEVAAIPALDLDSIDRLWVCYSQGRFGFSIQGRLLSLCGGQWERLWLRLGWKQDGVWTRYPHAFTWSLAAPDGHMPLINQLRGVRLMDALLNHPAIRRRIEVATG